jgi:predicted ester cyclase
MSNPPNREGIRAMFSAMNAAFPDGHWEILRQLADEDLVATHKTFHGTHQGSFMGIPPTGKEIAFDVIDIMTIKNGMIIEHRVVMDTLGMLQQLGAIPTPG